MGEAATAVRVHKKASENPVREKSASGDGSGRARAGVARGGGRRVVSGAGLKECVDSVGIGGRGGGRRPVVGAAGSVSEGPVSISIDGRVRGLGVGA
jgi:hypothetical protein